MEIKTLKGVALASIAGICWGSMGVAAQYLMAECRFTVLDLTSIRLLGAGLLLVLLDIFWNKTKHVKAVFQKDNLKDIIVYGIALLCSQSTFFLSIASSNAATATIMVLTSPLFIIAYLAVAHHRRIKVIEMICLVLAMIGVLLIITKGHLDAMEFSVAGVAWATFIAQGIACVLALNALRKRLASIETEGKVELFSWNMLGRISRIAVPSILQQSFISVGNIFIQGLINSYGSSVIAGYSAAIKLNTFCITSITTLGNGTSSFAAQNLGAGLEERVRAGLKASVKLALVLAVPFFAAFFFGGRIMLSLFMNEGSTVAMETGMMFLRIVSPFYFVISIKLMVDGVLRGAGAMAAFMTATFTDLILRVVLAYIFSPLFGTLGIWLSWPVGWIVAAVLSVIFYKKGVWRNRSVTGGKEE